MDEQKLLSEIAKMFHENNEIMVEHIRQTNQETRDVLRAEIKATRDELHATRDELRAEIAATRDELRAEITATRDELRAEFKTAIAELKVWMEQTLHDRLDELFAANQPEDGHTSGTQLRHEIQKLHYELHTLRDEMKSGFKDVRNEMHTGSQGVRDEMQAGSQSLRDELQTGIEELRKEISRANDAQRNEILAWIENTIIKRIDSLYDGYVSVSDRQQHLQTEVDAVNSRLDRRWPTNPSGSKRLL